MKFKLLHSLSLVFACAIFLGAAQQTFACMCPVPGPLDKESVKSAKTNAAAVFTGEVISIDSIRVEGTGGSAALPGGPDGKTIFNLPQYKRVVTFRVSDVWKGGETPEIKIVSESTDCDYIFEKGKAYLVYLSKPGDALMVTNCSRTALVDAKDTRKEIKILNKLKN